MLPGRMAAASAVVIAMTAGCSLRPVDLEEQRPLSLRSTIRAADDSLLVRLGGTKLEREYCENRAYMRIDDIPEVLVQAVVAAEDARFFQHQGFDLRSIARAALANVRAGEIVQGGSTITQQYVKNTFFRHPSRTFDRKARELRLAIEVERLYSKNEILERYLNTVYLGNGAYGVKAAAETYFGHGAARMSLREAALVAGLIKAPETYDPLDDPQRARARRNYVLERMAEVGSVPDAAATKAKRSPLGVSSDPPRIATREPYFVEAVKREILRDDRFGATEAQRANALCRGGLHVETTLVPELQRAAQAAVNEVLDRPGDPEAAVVALRPSTGEIVAMVGGRDWGASQVNLALGRAGGGSGRQPGSAMKPIVAAAALEAGMSLDDPYRSGAAVFTFPNSDPWTVRNSEGGGYGLMQLDEALIHSVNGVYARLALQLGPGAIATQAKVMGIKTKLPSYPSIALGSAEVSVLDMAAAYATLANYGTYVEPSTIRQIALSSGAIVKPDQAVVPSAMSPGNAYLLTKVLEQVIERGTGTAAGIGRPAAGKTGTTNNFTDAWFVGYTPDLVAAVWVGYPQGAIPMTDVHGLRVYGGTLPALIWRGFMVRAVGGTPVRRFEVPESELVVVEIDPVSGLLAAPWCPGERRTMLRQLQPTERCALPDPEPLVSPRPEASSSPDSDAPTGRDPGRPKASPSRDSSPEPSPERSPSPSSSPKATPKPSPSPTE